MAVTDLSIPAHPPRAYPPTYPSAILQSTSDINAYAVSIQPYPSHWSGSDDLSSPRMTNGRRHRGVYTRLILKVPVRGVGVVLYNVSTLGIPSVYHRHYGYHARSLARRVIGLGLPANVMTYDIPLYHYDPTLYELTPQQIWEETFNQIAAGWKTLLAVSSTAVLGCVVGFVQLLTACNSAVYRTVVLSAFILVWGSFVSGTYYIGHKDNFLAPLWSIRWRKAARDDYRFWTLMALPALLSAWAGILCILVIVVVAVTGFCESRVKLDGPLVASCAAVALIFIVALSLIWNAVKRINASPNMQ